MDHKVLVGCFAVLSCATACSGKVAENPAIEGAASTDSTPSPTARRTTLATIQDTPQALVLVGDEIFITTRKATLHEEQIETGGLYSLKAYGGEPTLMAIDRLGGAYEAIATAGGILYWTTSDGRVLSLPTTGGEVSTWFRTTERLRGIAADNSNVYVSSFSEGHGRVRALSKIDRKETVVHEGAFDPSTFVLTRDGIVVSEQAAGHSRLVTVRPGGVPTMLADVKGQVCSVAVRSGRFVWSTVTTDGGRLSSLDGRGKEQVLSSATDSSCALALDATSLYAAPKGGKKAPLMRVRWEGSLAEDLLRDGSASDLATLGADDRFVYWLTQNAVVRIEK